MNYKAFTKSASYYDLLYREKSYVGETKKIHSIIKSFRAPSKNMLDLGCGTGEHAIHFSKLGYSVCGIDASFQMVRIAKDKARHASLPITYTHANMLSFKSTQKFGVAVSLFHVTSYLLTHKDVSHFFSHTYNNLEHGGLFIFDCWYGPGVQLTPPVIQTKTGRNKGLSYTRTKFPSHNKTRHLVHITHDTTVHLASGKTAHYKEIHVLRYYFYEEMRRLLKKAGFILLTWGDINNNFAPPKPKSWNVLFVAKKPFIAQGKEK